LFLNILYSCKKNNPAVTPASVTGQWNWIATYPGGNPASYPHFPLTPQNTGRKEMLVFDTNHQFIHTTNDTLSEAGTYTIGHGSYLPYTGASLYVYDSICFFVNGMKTGVDYYKILNEDTLVSSSAFSGAIGGGSIYYIRN
jgi:hypothetical protein